MLRSWKADWPSGSLKNELRARPAVCLALGLCSGLAFFEAPYALSVALLAVALTWTPRCVLAVAAGLLLAVWVRPIPPNRVLDPQPTQMDCWVAAVPRVSGGTMRAEAHCQGDRYLLELSTAMQIGENWRVWGDALPLRTGERERLERRGIRGRLRAERAIRLSASPWLFEMGSQMRRSFTEWTASRLTTLEATLMDALCLGVDEALDQEWISALQRTGTIHIISASGLQISTIWGAILLIIHWLPLPRSLKLLPASIALCIYAVACGLAAPVLRATGMALHSQFAYLFRRDPDPLSAMALIAVVLLCYQSWQLWSIGFQLSFAILIGYSLVFRVSSTASLRSMLLNAFHSTWVATWVAAPLVAYHFGIFSLVSLPANLLLVPLVPVIVVLALSGWAIGIVFPDLGNALLMATRPILEAMRLSIEAMNSWDGAAANLPSLPSWLLFVLYLGVVLAWRPRAEEIPDSR